MAQLAKISLLFFVALAFEDKALEKEIPPVNPRLPRALGLEERVPELAFAFAPAGLLFPYYIGVAYQLRALGLLTDSTPLGGSSAGAIVAAVVACGLDEHGVIASLGQLLEEVRSGEKLETSLRRQLEAMLPEDAVERAERHGLTIAYQEVLPHPRPHIVSSWESREDLIETILASCNFPFFFSRFPFVKCRGAWTVDGLFSIEQERAGCPPLPGERSIAVVAVKQKQTLFDESDIIQPGQEGMELPADVSDLQWDWWTALPAPDERIYEMIALGHVHAKAWAARERRGFPEAQPWRSLLNYRDFPSSAGVSLNTGALPLAQRPTPSPSFLRSAQPREVARGQTHGLKWPSFLRMPQFQRNKVLAQIYGDSAGRSLFIVGLTGLFAGMSGVVLAVLRRRRGRGSAACAAPLLSA